MINIDTIYQRVLALTNKEQRGYVTPLEFNLLANQAQSDIFEQYFYDINQLALIDDVGAEYSDAMDTIDEKIAIFETSAPLTGGAGILNLPIDLYRLGVVKYGSWAFNQVEVEKVGSKEWLYMNKSPLARPSRKRPVYIRSGNTISVIVGLGAVTNNVSCDYVRRPIPVEWGYNVVVDKALYNAGSSTDFELHGSEETKLVIKILELAGVVINKPGLVSIAAQKEASKLQQEKA